MKKMFLLLILLSCLPLSAQYQVFTRKAGFFSPSDKIIAYFFDSSSHRMLIKDEGDISAPTYGSLDAAMRKSPSVAGINGSFFSSDKKGTAIGMIVMDGKTRQPLQTGSFTVAGIVYDTGKQLYLKRSTSFATVQKDIKLQSALQGGPFLVENNRPIAGLNDTKKTTRTFIATNGKGKWCIAITSSLTLKDLSNWLTQKGTLGSLTVHSALNLDGGTSSSFWCHPAGVYHPSIKQVRNYIGIAPR